MMVMVMVVVMMTFIIKSRGHGNEDHLRFWSGDLLILINLIKLTISGNL